jgi:hypothetical protein
MADMLYAIPVKEAYKEDCECPICKMYADIQKDAVEFTMGPSYMEDDIRAMTDETGFCPKHTKQIMDCNNRLGMALIMKTHLKKTNEDIRKLSGTGGKSKLFKKRDVSDLTEYLHKINESCFVCNKIDNTFERYLKTIFYLYKKDAEFRDDYKKSKGMCNKHYCDLLEGAIKNMHGGDLDEFIDTTNTLYIENMERVQEDVAWFVNKFDYRYNNEPWKNSKDSLERANLKTNGILPLDGTLS